MCAFAAALALAGGAVGTGSALAYGHADQPIAQVEISANCDNPAFPMCQEVGLGGIWAWAELDTAGGTGTSGTMDYTISFCQHGGDFSGAFGHPGEGTWWYVPTLEGVPLGPDGAFPFFDMSSYDGAQGYYVLDFAEDDFLAVVPAAYGHYRNPGDWPAGAQFQTQVAP
jgi:hypothetical protein